MLYSRYSNPMDLVDRYIKRRRFGKFVYDFMQAEHERKKQAVERDREMMLWIAYSMAGVHGLYRGSFDEYKKAVLKPEGTTRRHGSDDSMTEQTAQSIIDGLFKKKQE